MGIELGFKTRQPLRVILCRPPGKGRREMEDVVVMKGEGQERKENE